MTPHFMTFKLQSAKIGKNPSFPGVSSNYEPNFVNFSLEYPHPPLTPPTPIKHKIIRQCHLEISNKISSVILSAF